MSRITDSSNFALIESQLTLLELVNQFNYASTDLISRAINKNYSSTYRRLKLLQTTGYLNHHFDKSYHLSHKPAVYSLTPKAAKYLRAQNIKANGLPNKLPSNRILERQLNLLLMYNFVKKQHGNASYLSKTQLKLLNPSAEHLPDGLISFNSEAGQQHYLIDWIDYISSTYRLRDKITSYQRSLDQADIPKTSIILLCTTSPLMYRLDHRLKRYGITNNPVPITLVTVSEIKRRTTG